MRGGGTLLSISVVVFRVSLFLVKTAFLFLFLSPLYGITLFVPSFTFKSSNKRLSGDWIVTVSICRMNKMTFSCLSVCSVPDACH